MIRLTELKLPLDHAPEDLAHLVRKTLGVAASDIQSIDVFKRSGGGDELRKGWTPQRFSGECESC